MVFSYSDETLSLVFDILHETRKKVFNHFFCLRSKRSLSRTSRTKYRAAIRTRGKWATTKSVENEARAKMDCGNAFSRPDISFGWNRNACYAGKPLFQTPRSPSKYFAARRIFNSLLFWKCGQTWSFMFVALLHNNLKYDMVGNNFTNRVTKSWKKMDW